MKVFCIILSLAVCSCTTKMSNEQLPLSPDQLWFNRVIKEYKDSSSKASNSLSKQEMKDKFLKRLSDRIIDSLKYNLKNFRVTVTEVKNEEIGNVKAFYAKFKDEIGNIFWMEFDYNKNNDTSLLTNPAYILLKSMPEKADTVLSFFYMADIEWEDDYFKTIKLQVVPFPKDFNFDSSRKANEKGSAKSSKNK
jgi:hypothetical protein